MKKKKETRGRKSKMHAPLGVSFNKALEAIGDSNYKNEKQLKKRK